MLKINFTNYYYSSPIHILVTSSQTKLCGNCVEIVWLLMNKMCEFQLNAKSVGPRWVPGGSQVAVPKVRR